MKNNKKFFLKILPILAFSLGPILNLIALPFITEKISPEEYGIYNYYIALINMIIMVSFLPSINSSILRFLNVDFIDYKVDKSTIFKFSTISIAMYLLLSGLFYFFYQDILIVYISFAFLFIYLVNYFKSYYNVNGYKVKFSFLLLSVTLSQYLILFLLYFSTNLSVYHILLGNLLFSILFITYIIFKYRNSILNIIRNFKMNNQDNKKSEKKILRFIVPSLAIAFTGIILATGDRIIIKNILPDGDFFVGIYSVNYILYAQVIDLIVAVFYLYIPFFLYSIYEKKRRNPIFKKSKIYF